MKTKTTMVWALGQTLVMAGWLMAGPAPAEEKAVAAAVGEGKAPNKAPETELGKLAASMKPGELKELATKGYDKKLLQSWYEWEEEDIKKYESNKMYNIFTYSAEAQWDSVTRQIFYMGAGHYASWKFVSYSADANEWRLLPVPAWCDPRIPETSPKFGWPDNGWAIDEKTGAKRKVWPRGHSDDSLAIWPEKRLFCATLMRGMHTYHIDRGEWLDPVRGFNSSSGGPCEAFPELGGFVGMAGKWQLALYSLDKGTTTKLGSVPFDIEGVMEYNPVHKVMVIGGGHVYDVKTSRAITLLDRNGKLTPLKPMPEGVWLRCVPNAKFMCDPVSGEYVVQTNGGDGIIRDKALDAKVYAYHPIRDEWKEIPGLHFPGGVGATIDTYGVMMICGKDKVYIYKHKPMFTEDGKDVDKAGAPAQSLVGGASGNNESKDNLQEPGQDNRRSVCDHQEVRSSVGDL